MKINKCFTVGFAFGILLFVIANLISAIPDNKGFKICFDCYHTYGFPFVMHEEGTMLHLDQFIWSGVVANIAIALFISFLIGLVFKFIRSKILTSRVKLK